MFERERFLDGFTKPVPVLDMAAVVANPGVEDVMQGIFSQKQVAEQANAFGVFVIHPHTSQICNCVDYLFLFFQFLNEVVVVNPAFLCNLPDFILILFYEGDDRLSIVLWNVLCLVFEPFLHQEFHSSRLFSLC
jgi:hypothetical protein